MLGKFLAKMNHASQAGSKPAATAFLGKLLVKRCSI